MERGLAALDALNLDRLIFLGDAVGYNGFPEECVALLRQHAFQVIKGNHEQLLLGELPFSTCTNPIAPHTLKITRTLLSPPTVTFLRHLPSQTLLNNDTVLVHGSLRSTYEYLNRADKIRANFERLLQMGKRVAFYAHTHRPAIHVADLGLREIRRITPSSLVELRDDRCYLINPGTAGEPRRDRRLSFLVYDEERRHVEFVYFELNAADEARLRRRNRDVFGPLRLIAAVNRGVGFGRRVVRKVRHLVRGSPPAS
jgi:predicted phosphodiesterase